MKAQIRKITLLVATAGAAQAFADGATRLGSFAGTICDEKVTLKNAHNSLKILLGRRMGTDTAFETGGIDWLALNQELNPSIKDFNDIPRGAELNLTTPKLASSPQNSKGSCHVQTATSPNKVATVPVAPVASAVEAKVPESSAKASAPTPLAGAVTGIPSEEPTDSSEVPPSDRQVFDTTSVGTPDTAAKTPASSVPAAATDVGETSTSIATSKDVAAIRSYQSERQARTSDFISMKASMPSLNSHTGIRYGMPIVKDSILLPKTRIVNVFAQIKGGMLNGLTLFSDYSPNVVDKFRDQTFNLFWQRATVGWAIGTNFDQYLRRLEIVPRVGTWEVNGRFPHKMAKGGLDSQGFNFKRESIGLEASATFDLIGRTSTRLWHARDAAMTFGSAKEGNAASSRRTGIDVFVPTADFTLFGRKMALVGVAYAMNDAMFLTATQTGFSQLMKATPARSGDGQIYYALYYVGTGLTLTF